MTHSWMAFNYITNSLLKLGLHDIVRLILILYCLASIFKTIIDTIFLYSFQYNVKIVVTRMWRILFCLEKNLTIYLAHKGAFVNSINFGSSWWQSTDDMCAALLYPLGPTYLGTWGYRERMRRLAAAHDLCSGWPHIYGGKNQISNLAFIYTCSEIL